MCRGTKGVDLKATETLHERGQSLWLDNITRSMLDSGLIQKFIDQYSVTGLTSNPSIFDNAIGSGDYDEAIRTKASQGLSGEDLFMDLAIEDLRRAADLFLPVHEVTDGVDGWVSLEVSPLLAYDTSATVEKAKQLHERAGRGLNAGSRPGSIPQWAQSPRCSCHAGTSPLPARWPQT
jgi:transaldolase